MTHISYRNLHFPSSIVQRAVWLYVRFNLSLRDVEELLADRGVEVLYETIRRWVDRFRPQIARRLRRVRGTPHPQWHLDEMYVSIGGRWMYLWRAIDLEGEVLDFLVQSRPDTRAALKLMRRLLKHHGIAPKTIVTDKWKAYAARSANWVSLVTIIKPSGRTIVLRVHTSGSESENERCKASGHLVLPNDFSRSTRLSTITLTPEGT